MPILRSATPLLALAMDAGNGTFIEHVALAPNLRRARRRVVGNRGAAGVDGMTVQHLAAAWAGLLPGLQRELIEGHYRPAAIRRHLVPKPGAAGVRLLGIPTVLDRTVQQAIAQPLTALVDDTFSDSSFGFRPARGAHDAVRQAGRFLENGMTWVLHLDLEKFFDTTPHDLVLARLRERVDDPRLHELVARFLAVPFAVGARRIERPLGLPQGGPLSPVLANLLLDGLDRRLDDAGFSFCRYADDICLYVPNKSDAEQALAMIAPWVENGMRLRLNRRKTRVAPVVEDEFLGFTIELRDGHAAFGPSPGSRQRLDQAVRRLIARCGANDPSRVVRNEIRALVAGWESYFQLATPPTGQTLRIPSPTAKAADADEQFERQAGPGLSSGTRRFPEPGSHKKVLRLCAFYETPRWRH